MKYLILLIFTILFFINTPLASAHILEADGNIGAVLHIDPEDDPIAGQQSAFFFEFKDKENKFNPANCDCTIVISENGKEIYTQPLFQNTQKPSLSNANIFYTFPKRDVYEVQVTGRPTIPTSFQSFTLTYNIRVERTSEQPTQITNNQNWFLQHLIHFIGIGIILVFFIIYVLQTIIKKKKTEGKPTPHKTTRNEGGEKKDDKKDNGDIY